MDARLGSRVAANLTCLCATQSNHHSMTGSTEDPDDPAAVAVSIFMAVLVYAVRRPAFVTHLRVEMSVVAKIWRCWAVLMQ